MHGPGIPATNLPLDALVPREVPTGKDRPGPERRPPGVQATKGPKRLRVDAAPSGCDVVGCHAPATSSYLHARDTRLLEFSICTDHYARLQNGEQPVVVAQRIDLAALDGRPALLLEHPEQAH